MSEGKLATRTGLGFEAPVAEKWNGFELAELTGLNIHWLSASRDGVKKLSTACQADLGASLPKDGAFAEGGENRILAAGRDQWFVTMPAGDLPASVGKAGWATDQSDGWIALRLGGPKSRKVLEKLCPLDLHPSVFPAGSAARAPMETMIALIACEDPLAGRYAIYFQRSSGRSFLEHLRHAANSACHRA